jgi:hypothetical protein
MALPCENLHATATCHTFSLEAQDIDSFGLNDDFLRRTITFEAACARYVSVCTLSPMELLTSKHWTDGGGIRGLSELLLIKDVMYRLQVEQGLSNLPKPCDYFDLIGGTSTGGCAALYIYDHFILLTRYTKFVHYRIIALMLGRLRMDVDEAIECYSDLAKQVFSDMKWYGDGFKVKKLEEVIKSVVETITGDSESPLLERNQAGICRTWVYYLLCYAFGFWIRRFISFICTKNAHNMNANIPVLFRTYQSCEPHSNCKIWEAARVTSAVPTFFKRIEIGWKQPYIDGGLGCNNPSQLVLNEAKAQFGGTCHIGCLVSIGTGQAEVIGIKNPGLFQQIIPTDVINVLREITTNCEATHEEMLNRFANLPNTYFWLNVEQGMQGIELSKWEKLSNVEAHTAQYMKKKEVDEKLALLVNAIRVPRAQLTLEQLSMEESLL